MKNRELVWFLVPISGILRMVQGTWWKAAGRFVYPILGGLAAFYYHGFHWLFLVGTGTLIIPQVLPVTIIGDSIPGNWFNWIWVYILGYLKGVAALPFAIALNQVKKCLILSIVPMIVIGTSIVLSNVPATAGYFEWKWVELLDGVFSAYVLCYVLRNGSKK